MKQHFKTLSRSIGAAAATGVLAVQTAYAEVPAAAETALSEGQADALKIGGLVIAAIIAIWALKLLRKAL